MPFEAVELTFVTMGTASTSTLALDVLPVPPLVELTVTLLDFVPEVVPVTSTEKLHDAPPARVAVAKLTKLVPAVAVIVPPPHEPVKPLGVETTKPETRLSVKLTPVSEILALGLVIAKLRVVLPVTGMLESEKFLVMLGGATADTEFGIQSLLLSLLSTTLLLGSTRQIPAVRGLVYVPPAIEVTGMTTSNWPVPAPTVTVDPLAVQVNVSLPLMVHWMLPLLVTFVILDTVGEP